MVKRRVFSMVTVEVKRQTQQTTATSGHLVTGCRLLIRRAAGRLKNFFSTFVVLMQGFPFRPHPRIVRLERSLHSVVIKHHFQKEDRWRGIMVKTFRKCQDASYLLAWGHISWAQLSTHSPALAMWCREDESASCSPASAANPREHTIPAPLFKSQVPYQSTQNKLKN